MIVQDAGLCVCGRLLNDGEQGSHAHAPGQIGSISRDIRHSREYDVAFVN